MFLAGHVEMYADSLVKSCVPSAEYIKVLGQGAQSIVLLIKDMLLGQQRVLHIRLPGLCLEAEQRFVRSAKILSTIVSSELRKGHVPPFFMVYSVSTYPCHMVSQYIKGVTLREYIENQPTLGLCERLGIFKRLSFGLHLLHQNAIVHRDVKPDNILVDDLGMSRWIDFGIAMSAYENPLTRTEQALGTPDYAAPEQMHDAANVDERADIYSFGKVLFYLVTGDESFDPEKLPLELLMVIPRALQDDRTRRHQTVLELLEDVSEAYPDYQLLGNTLPEMGDLTVGRAFQELLTLFSGNTGKLKQFLDLDYGEWEELMNIAKSEVILGQV